MNLNDFMSKYIDFNISQNKSKIAELENFRDVELFIRRYEDAVTDFEKAKHSSQLDYFYQIKGRLLSFLMDFNTRDLQSNIDKVESATQFLEEKEIEFKDVSNNLKFIITTWAAFSERRSLDTKRGVKFFDEIKNKINNLEESFSSAGLEEIGRIEESAESLKIEITKLIGIFDSLFLILDKNVFIGDEAMLLKEELEQFLQEQIYTLSIHEIYSEIEELETKIDILTKTAVWSKERFPVIKIENKDDPNIYTYSLLFNDEYILEISGMPIEHSKFYKTNKYLYLENYPKSGIFNVKDIRNNFNLSEDHLLAINTLNSKSGKSFLGFSVLSFLALSLNILGILSIWIAVPLSLLFILLFIQNFNALAKKVESMYKVKDLFFFIPIDYLITKIGDDGLNFQNVIPSILINFDKIHPQDVNEYKLLKKESN